ncbi:hypothetical protein [Undibacterium sp. Tian12W]|uniref:hypothetical protein n=1 Tax=Undibacterium sp. Tian12W TaxID=3413054 RepID=UPI003BF2A634
MNKVDTKISHINRRDANLFAELGFPPNKADHYQIESRAQVEHIRCTQGPMIGGVDALGNGQLFQIEVDD